VIDDRFETAIRQGLFAVQEERSFVVTDSFDSAQEMLTIVRGWLGTRIPPALERRVEREQGAVHVHQDVRLRLLKAQ
jgi:hypothetical protein